MDSEGFHNKIDDYRDTIMAMIGFMNFYCYNDDRRKMNDDVLVFQGRRFEPSPLKSFTKNGDKIPYVTPDIAIFQPSKKGIISEVKKSFPLDQNLWSKTFEQLMSYDDDLIGWPSEDEKVIGHDIVLVLHQTRSAAVRKYYESRQSSEITFTRPFIMIQFNRSDERKSFFYFQKVLGSLSDTTIDNKLSDGVSVPMDVFVRSYSTIKICDSKPPLPYLIELIWTHVVLRVASENARFPKLRKNQKLDVDLEIESIIDELYKSFSFHNLHRNNLDRQPKTPKKEWVEEALETLVSNKHALWTENSSKKRITIFFKKYDSILDHFIGLCSGTIQTEGGEQTELSLTN